MDLAFKLLPLTVHQMETWHCVYSHYLENRRMYVGVCKVSQVMLCPDARRNTEWVKLVQPAQDDVYLSIDYASETLGDCFNKQSLIVRNTRPHCNVNGMRLGGRGAVTCVETGKTYRNATEASHAMGISLGALSNHLNARPGYKRVGGFTFKRGIGETMPNGTPVPAGAAQQHAPAPLPSAGSYVSTLPTYQPGVTYVPETLDEFTKLYPMGLVGFDARNYNWKD